MSTIPKKPPPSLAPLAGLAERLSSAREQGSLAPEVEKSASVAKQALTQSLDALTRLEAGAPQLTSGADALRSQMAAELEQLDTALSLSELSRLGSLATVDSMVGEILRPDTPPTRRATLDNQLVFARAALDELRQLPANGVLPAELLQLRDELSAVLRALIEELNAESERLQQTGLEVLSLTAPLAEVLDDEACRRLGIALVEHGEPVPAGALLAVTKTDTLDAVLESLAQALDQPVPVQAGERRALIPPRERELLKTACRDYAQCLRDDRSPAAATDAIGNVLFGQRSEPLYLLLKGLGALQRGYAWDS